MSREFSPLPQCVRAPSDVSSRLSSPGGVSSDPRNGNHNASLVVTQHLLDDAISKGEKLEALYLEARERILALESHIDDLAEDDDSDKYNSRLARARHPTHAESSSQRYIKMRETLRRAQTEVSTARRQTSAMQIELVKTKTEYSRAQTDCK